jgi:hypothetical protein
VTPRAAAFPAARFPAMIIVPRLLLLVALLGPALRADHSRRIFDFTPVSATNPVVATIDGDIEIPLSELRGFRDAEKLTAITDPASLGQKRAVLDALLDEYLMVDRAYRDDVPGSPGFARQMEATRTMVLTDFMAMRAAAGHVAAAAADPDPGVALAEKLFEAAKIEVSNESYDLVKRAARAVDAATGSRGEMQARLHAIVAETPEAVLVRYEDRMIGVRQIVALYAGLPVEKRPAVQTESGMIELIKPLILPELMAREALKQGIAAEPAFKQKIIQNQNALLRFHAQGAIERRANEFLRAPDLGDRLREWYEAHRSLYQVIEKEQPRQATFDEALARVEGDYSVAVRDRLLAEEAASLRKLRSIRIDESVLTAL